MGRELLQRQSPRIRRLTVVAMAIGATLALAGSAFASTSVTLTIVSKDIYKNTTSFHKTQVEPDTFSFGSTIVSTFQTGRFTDGGSSNLGWATSTDNGQTWTHGFLPKTTVFATPPGPWDRISDPSVSYDPKHDVWMILGLTLTGTTGEDPIVNRSTDGGLTWQNPVTVVNNPGTFFDKTWIGCDTWSASPNYGNCYVEYDDAGQGDLMRMARSTDGGLTWSSATVPSTFGLGGQPVAQPNGTVVVPYAGNGIQSLVSADGGKTYSVFTIASENDHGVAGNLRTSALPSAEVDAAGNVYVVWQDCRFRSGCSSNDIVMSTSSNGKNWSSVVRIPIDATNSGADHFIPGIGVDKSTSGSSAHLALAYYFYPVANCNSSTCKLTVGYISSTNGGSTWSNASTIIPAMKLTGLPLTNQGYMVGDYISASVLGNGKADTVVSYDPRGTCTLGQITSCKDFMFAPTGGLSVLAGTNPVGHDAVVSFHSDHAAPALRTAL
jgi:hypothetical protein